MHRKFVPAARPKWYGATLKENPDLLQDLQETLLISFSDILAIGALAYCTDLCISVPEEISIIGFDDIRYAEVTDPPLTTISQPAEEIGE